MQFQCRILPDIQRRINPMPHRLGREKKTRLEGQILRRGNRKDSYEWGDRNWKIQLQREEDEDEGGNMERDS